MILILVNTILSTLLGSTRFLFTQSEKCYLFFLDKSQSNVINTKFKNENHPKVSVTKKNYKFVIAAEQPKV